ncbi:hypothetical protein C7212DRAFT_220622 [Tuber magnatum]|uniref:Uncharacterized protein n=1 Tax=Tuber magnatum TaxID=42249 RepID=A0A317SJS4_9PEZI|nr:hypothetical protein C7212DRAFT_220622 [Tuber magnatum]
MASGAPGPTPVAQHPTPQAANTQHQQRGHSRQTSSARQTQHQQQPHQQQQQQQHGGDPSASRRETRPRGASQSAQQQNMGVGGGAGYVDDRGSTVRVGQPTTGHARAASGGSAQPRVHAPRPAASGASAPSGGQPSGQGHPSQRHPQTAGSSKSRQTDPARPAPEQSRAHPQAVPSSNRVSSQAGAQQPTSSNRPNLATPGGSSSRQTQHQTITSSFPHAFERWERLSSRWEGLTGYWISRLEHNREELAGMPIEQEMARQISDLSTAGANLFQAVVELQRLRASSERKFQRWFFDTKADQERAKEMSSELERSLRVERQQRADAVSQVQRLEKEKVTAEKLVEEMRRELQISKEECRRSWEELGRKEQEEREKTNSLKEGNPTLFGGIQVFPMPMRGPDRGSARPRTAGSSNTGATPQLIMEEQLQDNVYGREAVADYGGAPLHHEPHLPSPGQVPPTSASGAHSVSDTAPPAFPQQQSHRPSTSGQQQQQTPDVHPFYQHQHSALHLPPDQQPGRTLSPGEESYVTNNSAMRSRESGSVTESQQSEAGEGDGGWEYDSQGNPTPVSYQRREPSRAEEEEESWDTYPTYDGNDYESNGGGSGGGVAVGYGRGWEGVSRAHHHPTRLSDVPEEDEERRTHLGSEGGRVSR